MVRPALFGCLAITARADVDVVKDSRAAVVVVIADQPTAVARYAAEELVYHVEKATGARLAILSESAGRPERGGCIYIGDTRAARAAGIDVPRLAPETSVLRMTDSAITIAGGDAAGDPLDPGTFGGTLFGVYEWLERDVGVRWLWPGELGTVVPKTRTVRARNADTTFSPAFFQRNVRGGLTFKGERAELGFTPEAAAAYAHDQAVFLRRHRMGKNVRLSYGHAFTDWWKKYGEEHPEWFQLVNGRRGPPKPGANYSMCVSNPEFRRKIVELWRERRAADPGGGHRFVNAIENGIMGLCECDNCRAWDGPPPADFLKFYPPKSKVMGSRFVTDRYVRYWLDVQRQVEAIDPEATVVVYNYFNYFHPPSPGTMLNSHLLVGSYPSAGWFPRSAGEHDWFKQQWTQWHETGARLFSRGNYCLDGYTMPLVFAHQFADEFQHQARHGMEATDYDALTGHWATQGTNLYLLMRLHTRPQAAADELLAEYFGAFGAAAPHVKAYFDYWERYAAQRREEINRQFEDNTSRWRAWALAAHVIYPADSFAAAEATLAKAEAAVRADSEALARVRFLRNGLMHARLCAEVSRGLTLSDPTSTPERGREALARLIAFRRAHEREWISNFNHCAWVEDKSWRFEAGAATPAGPVRPATTAGPSNRSVP
ncbi:MAG: DUF4838 domain-containing protein [Opitutaceae bacterium]|nr:DUF4838 domain-containing protein [Opitutaceae bacterium]